jgi:hypothetical protein
MIMVWTTYSAGDLAEADKHMANWNNSRNELGEIRMFALSISGAVTKANLQSRGWAICDGTTPATQGISDADITTTPNLEHKFIRMSDDESSGGSFTEDYVPAHDHPINYVASGADGTKVLGANGSTNWNSVPIGNNTPSGTAIEAYELAYFIKVKII